MKNDSTMEKNNFVTDKPKKKFFNKKTFLFGLLTLAFSIALTVFILFTFIFRLVDVEGNSMFPTLQHGQKIFINRVKSPKRNDIVAFNYKEIVLIKRILGLPGDKITVKENEIYINDKKVATFIKSATFLFDGIVPENKFFAVGDNLENSSDSRDFGFFDLDDVIGIL
ncbi:signal peptidase I [Mesomycoplasma ovipneumoniae]|uniref:signal peptidase I n=2 Tax=Mesomycoplasma ovipneumoniae TaxID=29562 RepID=UPI00296446F2|nr:signal peptidase I [Mesomycoplasma ovipneumoniae]MDW2913060.1 signal peptidase I [Mesomycoplasma ovipneumoniae]